MRKRLLPILSILFLMTLLSFAASTSQKTVWPSAPNIASAHDLAMNTLLPVNSADVASLTEEQFLKARAEATGRSIQDIRSELQSNDDPNADYQYRKYEMIFDLGGDVKAKAGILAQVQEIHVGAGSVFRFHRVFNDTGYIEAYRGGTFDVVKHYVHDVIESDTSMVLAASGFAETAVADQYSKELNLTAEQLLSYGWSYAYNQSAADYYRYFFQGLKKFAP